jgi:chromate transporter
VFVPWKQLLAEFLKAGNLTLGGGDPTIAALEKSVMRERQWLPAEEFGLLYGIARLTPGTNVLAFIAAMGSRLRGWPGALAAVVAASAPAAVLVVAATALFETWSANPLVAAALGGAMAAVIGLILSSSLHLLRSQSSLRLALPVCAAAFAAAWFGWASPLVILLAGGACGAVFGARE